MENTIEKYISDQPLEVQEALHTLRKMIFEEMPETAFEFLYYNMPAFDVHGRCVHYAGFKKHVGFYPTEEGITKFAAEFDKRGLKYSKSAVQFPLSASIPVDLVKEIVKFRVNENIDQHNSEMFITE